MIKFGSLFHSVGWFFLIFMKTFIQIAIVNIYLAISFIFVDIPHHTLVYDKARRKKNIMEYIVYREIAISFGRFLGILFIFLTGSFIASFVISGLGVLSWFFL